MKIKKDFILICLMVLFVGNLYAIAIKAVANDTQTLKDQKNKISSLFTTKNVVGASLIALAAYSIIEGDIPFIDLPQGFVEYFNPISWYNYVTAPSITPIIPPTIESIVNACMSMADSSMSQASQVKSFLECIPNAVLQEIIGALPESLLQRVSGAEIIVEKVAHNIHSVSEAEVNALIESIKACIIAMKESGKALSMDEKVRLFRLYLDHYDVINAMDSLAPIN